MSTHHTPYNCAIDLLGAPLPTGRLYNVSKLKGRQWPYRHTGCRHHLAILFCFRNCFFFFPSLRIRTKLRPCIDFRGLNKITARYNTHCLYCPLLLSCYRVVTQLFSANWISWWGLESGASGRQPTLWVGLGAVFQALVNDAVWDFMNHFVFVYLDDILIFSRFLQEYMSHVRQVQPSR